MNGLEDRTGRKDNKSNKHSYLSSRIKKRERQKN